MTMTNLESDTKQRIAAELEKLSPDGLRQVLFYIRGINDGHAMDKAGGERHE